MNNKKKLLKNIYRTHCRSCENSKLRKVFSLGFQPLANNLLDKKNQIVQILQIFQLVVDRAKTSRSSPGAEGPDPQHRKVSEPDNQSAPLSRREPSEKGSRIPI